MIVGGAVTIYCFSPLLNLIYLQNWKYALSAWHNDLISIKNNALRWNCSITVPFLIDLFSCSHLGSNYLSNPFAGVAEPKIDFPIIFETLNISFSYFFHLFTGISYTNNLQSCYLYLSYTVAEEIVSNFCSTTYSENKTFYIVPTLLIIIWCSKRKGIRAFRRVISAFRIMGRLETN